jgi:hypothetical protein
VELKNRKAISALLAAVEIHVSVAWAETERVLVGRSKGKATFDDVCESFLEYWRENETVMRAGKRTGNGRTRHGIFAVATNKTRESVYYNHRSLGRPTRGSTPIASADLTSTSLLDALTQYILCVFQAGKAIERLRSG